MAKKYPPGYVKDPKKVAAGKKRAEQGIKINGRYAKKDAIDFIEKFAQSEGVDIKDKAAVHTFFLQNETALTKTITKPTARVSRNVEELRRDIDQKADGTIEISGVQHTRRGAKMKLVKFGQFLETEFGVYHVFWLKPTVNKNGLLSFDLPEREELRRRVDEGEEIGAVLEEHGIGIVENIQVDAEGKVKKKRKKRKK